MNEVEQAKHINEGNYHEIEGRNSNMSLNQYQMKALEEMRDSGVVSPELFSAFADENGALNAFLCRSMKILTLVFGARKMR